MLLDQPDQAPSLEADQQAVLETYHDPQGGRVCVDAGAGTGKTKTLIETVAEAILQELESGNENPVDDILVTTFTRDAAAELKTSLKKRLRDHETATETSLDPSIWHSIETQSHIQTIDSFVRELLAEIAADLGLPTGADIRSGLEEEDLYEKAMEALRDDPELEDEIARLEDAYPEQDYLPFPPDSLEDLLITVHEKRREFCWTIDDLQNELERSVTEHMYRGREPPFDEQDVLEIGEALTGERGEVREELVDHVGHVYDHNLQLVRDFGRLVEAFDAVYERLVREEAALSYTDVTYYVWEALEHGTIESWEESLQERFDHIFIDEFQDTNYAQCRILSRFIRNQEPQNCVLLIGDVKQSIYQWRSAEPRIFSDIIRRAQDDAAATDEYLGIEGIRYQPLTSNFRSHEQLVSAANHVFDNVFDHPGRGDSGFDIHYTPLEAKRNETEPEEAHLHVLDIPSDDNTPVEEREAERIAQTVSGIVNDDQLQVVDTEHSNPVSDPELRSAKPGDIALLFRRRRYMELFARHLRDYGVATALDVTSGLFREPEVRLLINVLDWFAHPHSKDSLIRILRSPITAISDESLRYLASEQFYLSSTIEDWPSSLPTEDQDRIQALIDLRDDLRWDREGSKADLLQRTVRHTAFDAIVLTDHNGKQRYGNIWQLIEVVNEWEEDELLDYREFVTRLKRLRGRALSGEEEHPIAQIADDDSDEVVRLTTVHRSKGLEYPVVFLPDLDVAGLYFPWQDRMHLSRQHGIALHPQPGEGTVAYDPGGGGSWISGNGTGTIWVSDKTDGEGAIKYDNQLHNHLRDDIAEHWRVLYVAFTRASDHLFLGLHEDGNSRADTWNGALREYLEPEDGWRVGRNDVSCSWVGEEGSVTRPIPIGFGDVRPGTRRNPDPIGIEAVETSIQYGDEDFEDPQLDFVPRSVTPTSLHDLLECPLRFQYRMLQRVSDLRADIPPESNPPDPLRPSAWGGIVHEALEHFHDSESALDRYLETCADNVEERLREDVVPAYKSTQIWNTIANRGEEVLPEYELEGVLAQSGTELYLNGKIDLLYRTDEGWSIADFKTGAVPYDGDYLYDDYRYQLTSYAWLLQDAFNITLEDARLVFVTPEVEEVPIEVDLGSFVESLEEVPRTLDVDSNGLPAHPEPDPADDPDLTPYSRCGSCAYRDLCPEWT